MEFLRRAKQSWRWRRGKLMLHRSGRSAGLPCGAIRRTMRRSLTRFAEFPETQPSYGRWAKRRGRRQATMIESASCENLWELLRRRAQRDGGGNFLEREAGGGDRRGVVYRLDAN